MNPIVPLTNYILLSAVIFIIGAAGCFFKRNIIQILLSIELMTRPGSSSCSSS